MDRKTLLEGQSNKTEQVLSSRFSNVTPHDCMTLKIRKFPFFTQCLKKVTPVSRNQNLLCMSPMTRFIVSENNTEIVENYQLNTKMPMSLRSTRKRVGDAFATLHNCSKIPDTSFEADKSALSCGGLEVSQSEPVELLSLDAQPTPNEILESNNFIQFVKESDDVDDAQVKEIFEITSNDNSLDEEQSSDESELNNQSDEISDGEDMGSEQESTECESPQNQVFD